MLHCRSILKALLWLIIGIFSGLASLFLVLVTSAVFTYRSTGVKIDKGVIMWLCVALMSAAGGDYLLSEIPNLWKRVSFFLFCVIALLIVYFLLTPNTNSPVKPDTLNAVTNIYIGVTIIYCMALKTKLYYREILNKRLNFR
jgi:uncharacterized membrane protein YfcA